MDSVMNESKDKEPEAPKIEKVELVNKTDENPYIIKVDQIEDTQESESKEID